MSKLQAALGVKKSQQGFSLVELMSVVVVIGILAIIGQPAYKQYRTRAQMAEAIVTLGAITKNLTSYYYENGSFTSASGNPIQVPGAEVVGEKKPFNPSSDWTALGTPIAADAMVSFSYEVYAGQQLPNGNGVVHSGSAPILHLSVDSLDLGREIMTSSLASANPSTFQNPIASSAFAKDPFGLDFKDFNFSSYAQMVMEVGADIGGEEVDGGGYIGAPEGEEAPADPVGGGEEIVPVDVVDEGPVGGGGGGPPLGGCPGQLGCDTYAIFPVAQCSFGQMFAPVDFGIAPTDTQAGDAPVNSPAAYNWVVIDAVSNMESGEDCTLMARTIQTVNGQLIASDVISINTGQ